MMFVVVLEHVEPPQNGCLADPTGAHHHQLGSVLLEEHGYWLNRIHNLPQGGYWLLAIGSTGSKTFP